MRNSICRSIHLIALMFICVSLVYGQSHVGAENVEVITIQVDPNTVLNRISPDFIGFGYESSAVAQSNFFSVMNTQMVNLYRNLSQHGVIRIGGNVSDHTKYLPNGPAAARSEKEETIINQGDLIDLGKFVRATGWKVMWGLNLGSGSKDEAVKEAVDVDAALGSQLQSFEIGNEVEALPRFKKSYEAYHAAYLDYKAAIRAALPNASFSGPDSIGNWAWTTNFASTEAGDLKLLTQHYYRGGARDPASNLEKLLEQDDGWQSRLKNLEQIGRDQHIAFRINEVNSFFGGGKPGVSDTFSSALWCLDYMFLLASYGCEGVNMETDINQLGWISHYSPIVHDAAGNCTARPEYYGMLAFAMAGKGALLKMTLNKSDINLTAYATTAEQGCFWITVVNKDLSRDVVARLALPEGHWNVEAFRLGAPSVESKDQVTLAGAEVSADGKWTPRESEKVATTQDKAEVLVAHASAALVCLRR
jgi:hypothetical protein